MSTLRKSIFDFDMLDANGERVSLELYRGQVCLLVNISSRDETAEKKYRLLASIMEKYKNKEFAILLFPCSQFGTKTSTQNELDFVTKLNLNVGTICKEIDVSVIHLWFRSRNTLRPLTDALTFFLQVNGPTVPELFKFLKTYRPGNMGGFINCNFTIFITDRNGYPVERLTTNVHPYFLEECIEKNF